eukprot:m51a1_g14804 hypothetical protein (109) ;mRNA; f:572020-573402
MFLIAMKIIEWSAEDQNKLFDEVSKIPGIDTVSITSFKILNTTFVCMPVDRTEELYCSSMPHIKYEMIAELLLSVYNHCSPRSKETEVMNYVKDIFFHFNIAVPYFDP